MKRRDFLKLTGAGGMTLASAGALLSKPSVRTPVFSRADLADTTSSSEYPFPYDSQFFEAAERIVFLGPDLAAVNVIPKQGRRLDIKLYRSAGEIYLAQSSPLTFYGVNDSLDILLRNFWWGPELYYRIEYRDSGEKGSWRSAPPRRVKTPRAGLQDGKVEAVFISDDHTFDDADMLTRVVWNQTWREQRLSGDYVNTFLKTLQADRTYIPREGTDEHKMMSGFCLASAIRQILTTENPDFIVIVGDTTGLAAGYKWKGLGLQDPQHGLSQEVYEEYSRLFWLRMRKMYSAVSPHIPIYVVLGNHDGESAWDATRVPARKYRKKFWRMPGQEDGNSPDENYFSLILGGDWMAGRSGFQFVILDNQAYNAEYGYPVTLAEWTLGREQKEWFKKTLAYESDWKFAFLHHALGGWPRGTNEAIFDYCYGRGPLFTAEDYKPYLANPEAVEQVELTRMMSQAGGRCFFYGHDHVHHVKNLGNNNAGKKMYGICVGSTKNVGELNWYKGALWQSHYGYFGYYWGDGSRTLQEPTFWGPSGYTKLTVGKDGGQIEYKRAAFNHPNTNLSPLMKPGHVVSSLLL